MLKVYENSKSWAFDEAKKILKKINGVIPEKGFVLFETGYGPSGLPHIGTFGEVVRTCFVKFAFEELTEGKIPTKLICVSDDMDGLRKVPDNVPHREMLQNFIGMPLTSVPDPFKTHESYGHNMNSRLRAFLDSFGFQYEFLSATECYKNGLLDGVLLKVVQKYDQLMNLMLKNLGEERSVTYSPLMPICPKTGKVLMESVIGVNQEKGTMIYKTEDGEQFETVVTGGRCKLQWKIDFGARWASFDVDYEIFGKDHAPNAHIYQAVCRILDGGGPVNFIYELFLGEDGAKISKSKGNGISVEEWLKYAPNESLALFMYQKPKTAKKLFFDVIPKMVDEYIKYIRAYHAANDAEKHENPVFFVHFGKVPEFDLGGIDYTLLLHLASAASPETDDVMWGFISKYNPNLKKGQIPFMDKIVECSIRYFNDFVKPKKKFRAIESHEKPAFLELKRFLEDPSTLALKADEIQTKVYEIGMSGGFELKSWFSAIYEILLGQKDGPRVGTFFKFYGIHNSIKLLEDKIS